MRVRITLFLLILASTLGAQVPDYLDNNPKWRQYSMLQIYRNCLEENNKMYYLNGDTIIGDVVYKKVFERCYSVSKWYGEPPPPPGCESILYYDRCNISIRQDSLKLMVYADNQEHLLYDFDLSVGDTLPVTWNMHCVESTITNIDSILIGDSFRKKFTFLDDWGFTDCLIEGVGFCYGFLDYYYPYGISSELLCFTLNDIAYYPSYGYPCDLTVSIPTIVVDEEIKICPNPVIDIIAIETNTQTIYDHIFVYDLIGKEIQLKFKQERAGKIVVDCSNLKPGFYILQLKNGKAAPDCLKIIKQ